MNADQPQPDLDATPPDDEHVWPPPRYSQQDRRNRLVGGTVFGALLFVWLVVYWPNVTMRVVTLGLLIAIVWMTAPAVFDAVRPPQRTRVTADDHCLRISLPDSEMVVAWRDVASGQWRQDRPDKFGLWLFDDEGRILAHLDKTLLPDQGEAKDFAKWARQLAGLPLKIQWTQV